MLRVLVIAFVWIAVAYYLYSPLPDNIGEPWKVRLILAATKIVNHAVQFGAYVGYDSGINITRKLLPIVFRLAAYEDYANELQIDSAIYDGIPVRIYRPKSVLPEELLPGLVYYHGGGWQIFDIDNYDKILQKLSKEGRMVVVAVEYRLSPEYPFPVPVQDCIRATRYFMQNAAAVGADPTAIGVAGDSAGGNLAAAVSYDLSYGHREKHPIRFQALVYPMLQAFSFRTPAYLQNEGVIQGHTSGLVFVGCWVTYLMGYHDIDISQVARNQHTSTSMKNSEVGRSVHHEHLPEKYHKYTSDESQSTYNESLAGMFQEALLNPLYCPLMASDVSKMPPTLVVVAEFDVLRDDGLLYAKKLVDAGVSVQTIHLHDGFHAVFSYTRLKIGRDLVADFIKYANDKLRS
ncbi:hypothetical protein ScPMuIL_017766 [Solemya velum]